MRAPPSPSERPVSLSAAFLLGSAMQVAVVVGFAGASETAYRGVPSGLGLMFSVVAAVLAGPLAGVLVAIAGGIGLVAFVTNWRLGGWVAVVLWVVSAAVAGAIADRYRQAGRERDFAHASERRARQAAESESTRLAHLHNLTARLATAVTVRDVCEALVETATRSLGATASLVALLSTDETELETVAAHGYPEGDLDRWPTIAVDTPDPLSDAMGERSVVTIESAEEALARYPLLAELRGHPPGAQAAAPLLAGDALLGVLAVDFRAARRFSLADESLLLAIGRQCGQAIERARLFEAEHRARQRATQLRELASSLAAAASPNEVADIAALALVSILGGGEVSVGAITPNESEIEIIAAEGRTPDRPQLRGRIGLSSSSPVAEAIRGGRSILIGSPEEMVRRYSGFADAFAEGGDQSWACIPLRASGNVVGTLIVRYDRPQSFDDRDRAELQAVADQVALALERSLLQQAREEAVQLNARLERMKAVAGAMSPDMGVEEVAAAILAEGIEALDAEAGGIGVATREGDRLEFISRLGIPERVARSVSLSTPDPLTEAFRSGNTVLIEDPSDAGRSSAASGVSLLGEPVNALLAAPIAAAGHRIGVLGLRFDRKRSFSPAERRFVEALAEEAGEALELARLFEAEQRALKRAARLQEVTARLARSVTTEDAARAILHAATGGVGADAAAIALADDDGRSLRVVPGRISMGTLRLEPPIVNSVEDRSVTAHVYRNGRALWVPTPEVWEERFEDGFASQRHLGRSLYGVPIVAKGEAIGALVVYFQDERPAPSSEDAELIRSFAHQAGVALERARTYEVEHEAAMTLQHNLMPEGVAHASGVEADGRYLPATRGVHVGGDWYDIVDRPDGTVVFAVGDIAGHGLQAASAMGQVRSAWRALAMSMTQPSGILTSLDRFASGVEGAFFSTVLTVLLDPARNELSYASAGHPPPLLIEADGSTRFLQGGRSVPLGMSPDQARPQAIESLLPSAFLVLYTDGLVERRGESLDEGLDRLAAAASNVNGLELKEITGALLELVADDRHDDVAFLAIGPRRPMEAFRRSFPADAQELAAMRADLRAWLERSELATEKKEDVVLVCTEAASNAIEHAYIGRRGEVHVQGQTEDGRLEVSVSDDGRWRDPRPEDVRGRGLQLMRALIPDIEVERGERGTTVRLRVGSH